MNKRLMLIPVLVVTAVAFSVFGLSPKAHAHVILSDSKTGIKVLFHVTPEHDPIAGKESIISFDFSKSGYQSKDFAYSLTVTAAKGSNAVAVPTEVLSNVVLAKYTFPSQGLYTIMLDVEPKGHQGQPSTFAYSQSITRGVIKKESAFPPYVIAVLVGTLLTAVVATVLSSKDGSM